MSKDTAAELMDIDLQLAELQRRRKAILVTAKDDMLDGLVGRCYVGTEEHNHDGWCYRGILSRDSDGYFKVFDIGKSYGDRHEYEYEFALHTVSEPISQWGWSFSEITKAEFAEMAANIIGLIRAPVIKMCGEAGDGR